jgi:calcium-dependent protein kinase
MELCAGGSLLDVLCGHGASNTVIKHVTESEGKAVMRQLFYAVSYLHGRLICHRDLKPENVLFENLGSLEKGTLKVADFGCSRKFQRGVPMSTKVGTLHFSAPEVFLGRYTELVDTWSCGVLLFLMFCGTTPFSARTEKDVLSKVKRGNYSFCAKHWEDVSESPKDLIRGLLRYSYTSRLTSQQAMEHPWIQCESANQRLRVQLSSCLRNFYACSPVKKFALQVIAQQLGDSKIDCFREAFVALDLGLAGVSDGDGVLTAAELRAGLRKEGLEDVPKDLNRIVEAVCPMSYTMFVAMTLEGGHIVLEDSAYLEAFRIMDRDDDGCISQVDLSKMVAEPISPRRLGGPIGLTAFMKEMQAGETGGRWRIYAV